MSDIELADPPPLVAMMLRSLVGTHIQGSAGKSVTHPGGGLRIFPFTVIVHVQEGAFRIDLHRGDCLVVPEGIPHTFGGLPSGRLAFAHVRWTMFAGLEVFRLYQPQRRMRGALAGAVGRALIDLHAGPVPGPSGHAGSVRHYLEQRARLDRLLLTLLAGSDLRPDHLARVAKLERLQPALDLIARMRDPPPTRNELAAAAGLSPSRFSALFAQALGGSPVAHRNALRMQKAQELLLTSGSSISAIAERIGYRSLFHFSRQFRRDHGCSPSEYRSRGLAALAEGE
jgi:AraC family transcriptional regulator of arabinose operon